MPVVVCREGGSRRSYMIPLVPLKAQRAVQTCHEGRNELLEGLTLNREVVGGILVGFDGQK